MNDLTQLTEGRLALRNASSKIKSNNISIREFINKMNQYKSNETGKQVEVDPLIYAHAHNTTDVKELLEDFISNSDYRNFTSVIKRFEEQGIIEERIDTGGSKKLTFDSVLALRKHFGLPSWGDRYDASVIGVQNQKGGTGKTTSASNFAVGIAGDIKQDARVVFIDFDPQGSGGVSLMDTKGLDDDSPIVTIVDILLHELESRHEEGIDYRGNEEEGLTPNIVSHLIKQGCTLEDVIDLVMMNTHISNLKVIPAYPADGRFQEVFYNLPVEEKQKLAAMFTDQIIPAIKKYCDFIVFDVAPSDLPINWMLVDAVEFMVTPFTPNYLDFISTRDFITATDTRIDFLHSRGKNILSFYALPVNYDKDDKTQKSVLDMAATDFGSALSTKRIYRNKLFSEAAYKERTIFDMRPLTNNKTSTKLGKQAIENMEEVIEDLLNIVMRHKAKKA
ncbi:AAA family ATPase [Vibrio parahaemolyticus]|jgi:cellulose biosynthesis protein BcsQ|uniref:AAA family ATPase n=2 Tax=Vibrio harveyi group TaxID=717610 RepID=A0A9Q3UAR4_VIBPH|nr:AAA family ATPase [Vibrio parahaemolyticus]ELA8176708.1 AAA family ATPase [Vibrio alginolyticus]CAH1598824.1 putative Chromosome (Plasmid) partitioning protein ParA [Vibrio jasicida]EGQ9745868.1 AAA family ATPase [Vibrio parahaemolyticus]EJC7176147.1 AAA family ATPase [Vibrio parahaemolyticus]EJE4724586.1 AAA family ATPase [Vibrio parahaemolyticus]